jgi:hypothetical protein
MPNSSKLLSMLSQVSNRTLEVLSSGSEEGAKQLTQELQDMVGYLEEVDDVDSSRFLRVLQSFLDHTVSKEVADLRGMYSRAADRILNQVSSLALEGLEGEGREALECVEGEEREAFKGLEGDGREAL